MHHPQYSNEAVEIQLEKCVLNGTVKKVFLNLSKLGSEYFWTAILFLTRVSGHIFSKLPVPLGLAN